MADSNQSLNLQEEMEYLRSAINTLDSQINVLARGLEELRRAHAVIREEALKSSSDIRASIGAGVFVNVALQPTSRFLVPIGSDLYLELARDDAEKKLSENMNDVENSLNLASQRRAEIAGRYQSLLALIEDQALQSRKGRQ
ncbi:MAG: prefoldin subunit alpha [Thermoplasmataceae archaeon]